MHIANNHFNNGGGLLSIVLLLVITKWIYFKSVGNLYLISSDNAMLHTGRPGGDELPPGPHPHQDQRLQNQQLRVPVLRGAGERAYQAVPADAGHVRGPSAQLQPPARLWVLRLAEAAAPRGPL